MAFNDFAGESPENHEQKTICCIVADVSYSMQNEPINNLNAGLQEFHKEIQNNPRTANQLEIALVEFGSEIETKVEPALTHNFTMPTLQVKGTTNMSGGLREAIDLVNARKNWYKSTGQTYLRPWIILITDGEPDSPDALSALGKEMQEDMKNRKYAFLALAVQGANMQYLQEISGEIPPLPLQGTKFFEFFEWLSKSMEQASNSKEGDKIDLPDPSAWLKNFKI